jgi:hypothetical protein
VIALYTQFLGTITPQQLSTGLQFLAHGGTRQQLAAIILGSEEYFNKYGRNPNLWLNGINKDYFAPWGITPPPTPSGATRAAVANAIVRSDQGNKVEIQYLFKTYLGFLAQPDQLQPWVNRLHQTSLNQVSREFLLANLASLEGAVDTRGLTQNHTRSRFPAV